MRSSKLVPDVVLGARAAAFLLLSLATLLPSGGLSAAEAETGRSDPNRGESVLRFSERVFGRIVERLAANELDEAMATIDSSSPLDEKSLAPVRESFRDTLERFGRAQSWTLLTLEPVSGNVRSYRIRIIVYHEKAASLIEAGLYDSGLAWSINKITLVTDGVFDRAVPPH